MPGTLAPPTPAATAPADAGQLPSPSVRMGDFPDNEFKTFENIPVFAEHETTTPKGRVLQIGPIELQAIVNRCNRRISETGDYAVTCVRHVPTHQEMAQGVPAPRVIGFVGPFRLGRNVLPEGKIQYVILADFHIYKDEVQTFRRNPRRSAELWVEDRYEDMFLDPIAVLGAETPRLDLGLAYSRARNARGVEVLKYSSVCPGAMNVSVPAEKQKPYGAAQNAPEPGENSMPSDPETIQQIIDAFMELPVIKWAEAKMAEEAQAGAPAEVPGADPAAAAPVEPVTPAAAPAAPPAPTPPSAETVAAPAVSPAAPAAPAPPAAGGDPPAADAPAAPPAEEAVESPAERERNQKYAAIDKAMGDMGPDEVEQYMSHRKQRYAADADSPDDFVAPAAPTEPSKEQYARSGERMTYSRKEVEAAINKAIGPLQQELAAERGKRVDVERLQALKAIENQGVQLDPDKELERLCFSKIPEDKVFFDELTRIEKNYQRLPIGSLPRPLMDQLDTERVTYAKDQERARQHSTEARQICVRMKEQGRTVDYGSVLAAVQKGDTAQFA